MDFAWDDKRRGKLIDSACIAILVFITVMAFIFAATAQSAVASEYAEQLMLKNLLFMAIVAELVIIVTLLYHTMMKRHL